MPAHRRKRPSRMTVQAGRPRPQRANAALPRFRHTHARTSPDLSAFLLREPLSRLRLRQAHQQGTASGDFASLAIEARPKQHTPRPALRAQGPPPRRHWPTPAAPLRVPHAAGAALRRWEQARRPLPALLPSAPAALGPTGLRCGRGARRARRGGCSRNAQGRQGLCGSCLLLRGALDPSGAGASACPRGLLWVRGNAGCRAGRAAICFAVACWG